MAEHTRMDWVCKRNFTQLADHGFLNLKESEHKIKTAIGRGTGPWLVQVATIE